MAEHPLLDSLLEKLLASDDPTERAAIVAESAFDQLPATMALVARRCVVLRWFDATIIAALVDMLPPAERPAVAQAAVATLITLPFVEQLAWGLAYHDQTRAGLLARTPPALLQQAAALAVPAYRAHANHTLAEVEALYCAVASGQSNMATQILEALLKETSRRSDSQAVLTLLQTLDQASALPFAAPMPRQALHHLTGGLARCRLGDWTGAIADLDQAIALKPDYAEAYMSRGLARGVQDDWAGAIADLDQAIALQPDLAEAYGGRSMARSVQGDWAGAIADLDQFIVLKPDYAEAYMRRGQARSVQGDWAGAIADLDQAIALKPDHAEAYSDVGRVLRQLARWAEAEIALRHAVEIDSTRWIDWVGLADLARRRNDNAAWQYAIAQARLRVDDTSLYNAACFESVAGNSERALTLLHKAMQQQPDSKGWAKQDPDLYWIRSEPRFWHIVND